jgi:hypothetical protein
MHAVLVRAAASGVRAVATGADRISGRRVKSVTNDADTLPTSSRPRERRVPRSRDRVDRRLIRSVDNRSSASSRIVGCTSRRERLPSACTQCAGPEMGRGARTTRATTTRSACIWRQIRVVTSSVFRRRPRQDKVLLQHRRSAPVGHRPRGTGRPLDNLPRQICSSPGHHQRGWTRVRAIAMPEVAPAAARHGETRPSSSRGRSLERQPGHSKSWIKRLDDTAAGPRPEAVAFLWYLWWLGRSLPMGAGHWPAGSDKGRAVDSHRPGLVSLSW